MDCRFCENYLSCLRTGEAIPSKTASEQCEKFKEIFVSVKESYPETKGRQAHVYMKLESGNITKGMFYMNGKKPVFASYGIERNDVVGWTYSNNFRFYGDRT